MYLERGRDTMRLISIDALKVGMVIGRTIWNEAGHPLLQHGVAVSPAIITRLKQLNIKYLYIDDALTKGIDIQETVPTHVRKKVVSNITQSFQQIRKMDVKKASYVLDKQTKLLNFLVDDLLDAILNSEEVLTILSDAYLYDEYIYQHSFQVTMYALAIGRELGYNANELRMIGLGAMLHDIGKMMISTEVLQKPGRLSDEEFEEVKQHARFGFDILRSLHSISLIVAHCAFQHHERLDGSGYPRGLVDFEIHPYAKVIAVADVFDAMTTTRVYRTKMLPAKALQIIDNGKGTLYDIKVVEALKRTVVHYPNGVIIRLSDNRRGVISRQNTLTPALPWIRIFEENNQVLPATYELNLQEHSHVAIVSIELDYTTSTETM